MLHSACVEDTVTTACCYRRAGRALLHTMYYDTCTRLHVLIGLVHTVLCQLSAGTINGPSNPPEHQPKFNYAQNGQGGSGYSAGGVRLDGTAKVPAHIMCYTCHFHVQKGHAQGMENCRDPFLKAGIPQVQCLGPCGKIYRKLSADPENEDEYMVIRNCIPNCKDLNDDKGFTQCCSEELCNAAPPGTTRHSWSVLVTGALLALWWTLGRAVVVPVVAPQR